MTNQAETNSDFQRGDIFKMNLDPTNGHEQRGYRPFMVLSDTMQQFSPHMLLVAPISSKEKGYPFHVPVETENGKVTGVVLLEHIKSIDIMAYGDSFSIIDKLTPECVEECLKIKHAL